MLHNSTAKMETSSLQIRISRDLRDEADALFQNMGMDTTTAVRLFLTQAVARRAIPFDLVEPRDENGFTLARQKRLNRSIRQLEAGCGQQHDLIED